MAEKPDESPFTPEDEPAAEGHAIHLDERAQLIDAARESARTFDKAVLTFGAAAFGFSVAFVKDVAPHPAPETMRWLEGAWLLFSLGLLTILVSFLFSQQACLFEIGESYKAQGGEVYQRKRNHWSTAANCGNVLCVIFLFTGLLCWSQFALDNLRRVEMTRLSAAADNEVLREDSMKPKNDPPGTSPLKKTYTPPRTPPPAPRKETPPPPPKKP